MLPSTKPLKTNIPVGLTWKLIRIRPTRLGWYLLVISLLLWIMAVNYQANIVYILVFWLLGIMLINAIFTINQLLGLNIDIDTQQTEYFSNQPIQLTIYAYSRKEKSRWLWLRFEPKESTLPTNWQQWIIRAQTPNHITCSLPAQKRGRLVLPPLRCISTAPLGLLQVESLWQDDCDIVIFPAPIPHDFSQFSHLSQQPNQQHKISISDSSDEIAYLQEHQLGQPIQNIAWKSSAKLGKLLDKRFQQPNHAPKTDYISFRDYPTSLHIDQVAGYLCYRILQAEQACQSYVLELPNQTITPCNNQRQVCLTALGLWS